MMNFVRVTLLLLILATMIESFSDSEYAGVCSIACFSLSLVSVVAEVIAARREPKPPTY